MSSETVAEDRCETCGDPATQYDYDQRKVFCDRHIEQADFTVPLDGFIRQHRGAFERSGTP
jgi:hypothetical protein